jgi:hypothetical protein
MERIDSLDEVLIIKCFEMKLFIVVLLLFSTNCFAQHDEVKKTITTFFEGFHAKDTAKMRSVCSPKLIMQSIADNATKCKLTNESVIEFLSSIASIPENIQFKEELVEYVIKVDGSMAHVWTPYKFFMNGTLSHSGVNSFTLFKENGAWQIIHLIDTRRK